MRHSVLALTTAVVLLTATVANARPAPPKNIPLRRLLTNVAAYVQAHPNDSNGFYTLGRLQYFAASAPTTRPPDAWEKPDRVLAYSPGSADQLPGFYWGGTHAPNAMEPPARPISFRRTPQEQITFVRDAIRNLTRAIELRDAPGTNRGDRFDPARQPGLFELCLACAIESGSPLAKEVGPLPPNAPTPNTNAWNEAALGLYRRAYEASRSDKANVFSVAFEASGHWLRLVQGRGPTTQEKPLVAQAIEDRKQMDARPAVISPIILSLTPGKRLDLLLDNRRRVSFDLHGDGLKRTHTWLKPDTALLVWDPARTGKITSGKQLFGSVSWWLFWTNGYQALAALDDNRDGRLSGGELTGLALWFDRNQNGVSDPGEVVPLERTPIVSLSVRWTGRVGQSWESKGGATLKDGTRLTTWDWVTR